MADEAGLVFDVGHVERANPVLESLADVPGAPRFIQAERLAPSHPLLDRAFRRARRR